MNEVTFVAFFRFLPNQKKQQQSETESNTRKMNGWLKKDSFITFSLKIILCFKKSPLLLFFLKRRRRMIKEKKGKERERRGKKIETVFR